MTSMLVKISNENHEYHMPSNKRCHIKLNKIRAVVLISIYCRNMPLLTNKYRNASPFQHCCPMNWDEWMACRLFEHARHCKVCVWVRLLQPGKAHGASAASTLIWRRVVVRQVESIHTIGILCVEPTDLHIAWDLLSNYIFFNSHGTWKAY